MSNSRELAIITLADTQHGLVTRAQLTDLGVGSQVVDRMRRQGFLTRSRRGLYSVGPVRTSPTVRLMAAHRLLPGSVAYRRSAAALLGLPGPSTARGLVDNAL